MRERPRREKFGAFFSWKLIKPHFKWNIKTQDDHNQGIFSKARTLFSNFWKRAEEILPPSPPLVTRLDVSCKKLSSWQKKVVSLYLLLITPVIINSSFTLKYQAFRSLHWLILTGFILVASRTLFCQSDFLVKWLI